MSKPIYRVTLQSENEGARTFVFELSEGEELEKVAKEIAENWAPQGWALSEFGPLELGKNVMELITV